MHTTKNFIMFVQKLKVMNIRILLIRLLFIIYGLLSVVFFIYSLIKILHL